MFAVIFKILVEVSVVCVVFNYVYIFLAIKFKVAKELTSFLLEHKSYVFFIPPLCWLISLLIVFDTLIEVILQPLFHIVFTLPLKGAEYISDYLLEPIRDLKRKNELNML